MTKCAVIGTYIYNIVPCVFRKKALYLFSILCVVPFVVVSPQASGLPVIKIETRNGAEIASKEVWTNIASFTLTDPGNSENDILRTGLPQDDRIRGRGNTTWDYSKKPYRIRFRENVSLFGNAAHENWVLLAEYQDPTFLMNVMAFELGRTIFEHQPYTNSYQHVHLYLNDRYDGVYVLTEHRQASPTGIGAPGRVDIDPVEGWFVEMDVLWDEDPKFRTTNYDLPIMIKSPDFGTNSGDTRYDFVKNDWNELEELMASSDFPENGYRELIDMNTFIDFLMINETVRNHELGHPKSVFAYKDKGGKISMGPLWDFDWGFGYATFGHSYFTNYHMYVYKHDFFYRFFDDPLFLVKYKERWNEKYDQLVVFSQFTEELGERLRLSVAEDAERWAIFGGYWDDYDTDHARQIEKMTTWWNNRVSWLHTELNQINVLPESKDFGMVDIDYSEISPQIFTFVAYGEISDLEISMENGNLSDFEIAAELVIEPTGNGGYLASISIKPKNSLPQAAYSDNLIVNGRNQGKDFVLEAPLSFKVGDTGIPSPQNPKLNLYPNPTTGMVYIGTESNIKVYNLQGMFLQESFGDHVDLSDYPTGMYLLQVENKWGKIIKN